MTGIRERFLAKTKLVEANVTVDGETYWVRKPSVLQKDLYRMQQFDKGGSWDAKLMAKARCWLVAQCVLDGEGGNPFLEESDVEQLLNGDSEIVDVVFDAVMKLSDDFESKLKEQLKNLDTVDG